MSEIMLSAVTGFSNSGINKINLPEFTFEGVHPTNKGYEFIIGTLESTIKSII